MHAEIKRTDLIVNGEGSYDKNHRATAASSATNYCVVTTSTGLLVSAVPKWPRLARYYVNRIRQFSQRLFPFDFTVHTV